MPRRKTATADDGKSQRQRFIEAARELGTENSKDAFERALRKVATAPATPKRKAKAKR